MTKKTMTRSRQTKTYGRDDLGVTPIANIKRSRSYVIYGRSGSGKTTLCATFPKPMLYLNCKDDGTDSIADIEDIDVKDVETFEDFEFTYWWLKENKKRYRSVVIDTVSNIQQILVQEIGGEGRRGKKAGDWGSMTKQDWGDVSSHMKEWITNYRDLTKTNNCEVVFIAQDRVFNTDMEDDAGGMLTPEIGPALSPSIRKHLNAAVTFIGSTFVREREIVKTVNEKKKKIYKIEYCLRVGPSSIYDSKARKPKTAGLPSVLVDPAYEDIVQLMKGE